LLILREEAESVVRWEKIREVFFRENFNLCVIVIDDSRQGVTSIIIIGILTAEERTNHTSEGTAKLRHCCAHVISFAALFAKLFV
jgi:hypothetical protein